MIRTVGASATWSVCAECSWYACLMLGSNTPYIAATKCAGVSEYINSLKNSAISGDWNLSVVSSDVRSNDRQIHSGFRMPKDVSAILDLHFELRRSHAPTGD